MRAALLLALAVSSPLTITIGEIPLEPGTFWEFRESYTEHLGGLDSISDDITRFEVRGTPARPFLKQEGGADPGSGPIEVGDGWIRLGSWTGEDPLPLPLEAGRTGPPSEGGPGWSVELEEDITVPAGTFTTLRCALRTRQTESILWIALGVGVVRETQGAPGTRPDIERVLMKWGGPPRGPSAGPRAAPPPAR